MKIDYMTLKFIDYRLREMLADVEARFGEKTITSLYRLHDDGVHGTLPLRGVDLRCNSKPHGDEVAGFVNSNWVYDKTRPEKVCCLYHDVGYGWHLHLQTHPNTRRV